MCDIRICFLFGCTERSRSTHYFSVSGEDNILYNLFGYDVVYEHGDDASGPAYPADD